MPLDEDTSLAISRASSAPEGRPGLKIRAKGVRRFSRCLEEFAETIVELRT
jgi:hypothetical protein